MKKSVKKFLTLLLCFSVLFTLMNLSVLADSFEEQIVPQMYAKDQIEEIAATPDELNRWNANTKIEDEIILYDIHDNPNGYVYTLSTDGAETGFIQFDYLDGVYQLHSYAFSGQNEVIYLRERWSKENNAPVPGKIYYLGSMAYAVKVEDHFVDLISSDVVTLSEAELAEEYAKQVKRRLTPQSRAAANGSKNVVNYNKFTPVTMDDFQGRVVKDGHASTVMDHCTPTAGTNVMKYYDLCRGQTKLFIDDWSTFSRMYLAMDTNSVTSPSKIRSGTYWDITHSDGYSGLLNYANQRGAPSSDTYRYALGAVTGIKMSSITEQIDKNHPVMISVQGFPGAAGGGSSYHSVVVFGYDNDKILVNNGWTTDFIYYNYNSLAVHEYYYIGY